MAKIKEEDMNYEEREDWMYYSDPSYREWRDKLEAEFKAQERSEKFSGLAYLILIFCLYALVGILWYFMTKASQWVG